MPSITDYVSPPGQVPRTGGVLSMTVLALVLGLAWAYYLLVVNVQLGLRMDAALARVPVDFAGLLKGITLFAAILVPALLVFVVLARIGRALDAPPASPEQMLQAVREGHRRGFAQMRANIDEVVAGQQADEGLTDVQAADLRETLEQGLRHAQEEATLREQRYAADPALMRRELVATMQSLQARQRPGS